MADTTRKDVELALRASVTGLQNVQSLQTEVTRLTAQLKEQQDAMQRGALSGRELTSSLDQITRAGAGFKTIANNIQNYTNANDKLSASTQRLSDLQAKLNTLQAAGAKDKDVGRAQAQIDSQTKSVASQTAQVDRLRAALESSGIATNELAASKAGLYDLALATGKVAGETRSLADSYDYIKRSSKEAADAEKASVAQNAAAQREYQAFATAAIAAEERKQKTISQVNIALAEQQQATLDRQAKAVEAEAQQEIASNEKKQKTIRQFNQQLADALAADLDKQQKALQAFAALADATLARTRGLSTAGATAAPGVNSTSLSTQAILNPGAANRGTLAGASDQIAGISSGLSSKDNQTSERYLSNLAQIKLAQNELTKQSGLVDAFRQQEAAVTAANGAFEKARASVELLAAAVKQATVPDQALAASLVSAEAQATKFGAAAQRESTTLNELGLRLKEVGIDFKDLNAAQATITSSAQRSVETVTVLQQKLVDTGGKKGAAGLFGLRSYELQDLLYQVNDVITSLASGISIEQTAAQQTGQIVQIFTGAMQFIVKNLGYFAVAIGVAVVAFETLERAAENQTAIKRFQGILTASADGARATAEQLLASQRGIQQFGVSFADAGNLIQDFNQKGLNPAAYVTLGRAVKDLTVVYGVDLKEATSDVTDGFKGSMSAIDELDKKYDFLTEAQRTNIQAMFDQNDATGAVNAAFAIFVQKQDEGAQKARGPWKSAITDFKNALGELFDYIAHSDGAQNALTTMAQIAKAASDAAHFLSGVVSYTAASAKAALPGLQAQLAAAQAQQNAPKSIGETISNYASNFIAGKPQSFEDAGKSSADAAQKIKVLKDNIEAANEAIGAGNGLQITSTTAAKDATQAQLKLGDAYVRQVKERSDLQKQDQFDYAHSSKADIDANNAKRLAASDQKTRDAAPAGTDPAKIAEAVRITHQQTLDDIAKDEKRAAETKEKRDNAAAQKELSAQQVLSNELLKIQSSADKLDKTNLDARLRSITESYATSYAKVDEYQKKFGSNVGNGQTTDGIRSQLQAAEQQAKTQETLKYYEDATNAVVATRTDLYKEVNEQVASGAKTAADGYKETVDGTKGINTQLTKMVEQGLAFAEALKAAGKGTPALDAFIAKMQLLQRSATPGAGSAQGTESADVLKSGLAQVNDSAKQRDDLVAAEKNLVSLGLQTNDQAEDKIKSAFDATTPKIMTQVAALKELAAQQLAGGDITKTAYDTQIAQLDEIASKSTYVSATAVALQKAEEEAFSGGLAKAAGTISDSIGKLVDGQENSAQLFRDMGSAAVSFFADFLKAIAQALIQMEALNVAQALFKTSSTSGGPAGLLGGLLGGGGSSAGGIGGFFSSLFGAGAASGAGASSAASALDVAELFHSGGEVGGGNVMARSGSRIGTVAGLPKFHVGGTVGLQPGEQAAILQKGEKVLTKAQQAAQAAQNRAATGPSSPQPIKQ
ncbi:MAG: phage tail length tape measure family protein, partial [Janthinobacterium lividum]